MARACLQFDQYFVIVVVSLVARPLSVTSPISYLHDCALL